MEGEWEGQGVASGETALVRPAQVTREDATWRQAGGIRGRSRGAARGGSARRAVGKNQSPPPLFITAFYE